jgi:hypothetical protein
MAVSSCFDALSGMPGRGGRVLVQPADLLSATGVILRMGVSDVALTAFGVLTMSRV